MGTKRYTYNAAGYLIQVEAYSALGYAPQAEMAYNGNGQRLQMTAHSAGQSLTTQYTLEGSRPLVAASAGNDTTFFYGLSALAITTDTRAWLLADASSTPRQMSDSQGAVTLAGSYNPWGGALELQGTGNFSFGYLGGLLDAATGLIYVSNGQYYDPATGRFLTRNVLPGKTNPYVPWDLSPIGALLAPTALMLIYPWRRKGKLRKQDRLVFMAFMMLMFMNLACCHVPSEPTEPTPPPTGTPIPAPTTPAPQHQNLHRLLLQPRQLSRRLAQH